ncbi:hypothetical protein BD410DRAFT_784176 [Rickenella mellea]|uniref:histidine kinase n=1 Tax=Rickenella mellea TaxID=50990 RepID=A0A4Y7QFE2_9AGAM|nr:hypothetical protein BD410DRAFT_784176 [Rickenella mellea]
MSFWARSLLPATASSSKPVRGDDLTLHEVRKTEPTDIGSDGELRSTLPPPVVAGHSLGPPKQDRAVKVTQVKQRLQTRWTRLKKRMTRPNESPPDSEWAGASEIGTDRISSTSRCEGERHERDISVAEGDDGVVDEVIVDRSWQNLEHGRTSRRSSDTGTDSPGSSGKPEKQGTSIKRERDVVSSDPGDSLWSKWPPLHFLRWRIWPSTLDFFRTRYHDDTEEAHYQKELWFTSKPLAIWSSLFFVLNWVLGCILLQTPFPLPDKIFYFGVALILSVPMPFMVIFDFPRRYPIAYQIFLAMSTWCWLFYQVLFINLCGFYSHEGIIPCYGKDFIGLFYYATAMQTIALFGLRLHRFPAMLATVVMLMLMFGLIVPHHLMWIRQALNFLAFHAFLLHIHYMRELADRRLYILREQVKVQLRATQVAQVNERKASDSKRRLTSYVFHEVRVPLNTALIAVQNMDASGTVVKDQEVEFRALEGSLSMMSKVLNDVLDFNRMDSGRFESVARPYPFHQVMHSMLLPLRLATDARGLQLVTELDNRVDKVARVAAYRAQGMPSDRIGSLLKALPDEVGIVVGDEMRLRQIVTNLASNACKFTPTGGKLTISTRLVVPTEPSLTPAVLQPAAASAPLQTGFDPGGKPVVVDPSSLEMGMGPSADARGQADPPPLHPPEECVPVQFIVVRIEISDTGFGIRPKDLVVGRLFSAFNQTEQGRQQGGKGTGLGLALVRQIVKLSGGRLGVRSKVGLGSTFWVEIPLEVGKKALSHSASDSSGPDSSLPRGENNEGDAPDSVGSAEFWTTPSAIDNGRENSARSSSIHTQSRSALKGIMEQGGLVELAMGPAFGSVPTRAIGDASTGTDLPLDSTSASRLPRRPAISRSLTAPMTQTIPRALNPFFIQIPGSVTSTSTEISSQGDRSDVSPTTATSAFSTEAIREPLRVLVVDDDSLTRKLMKRMLTRLGCLVSTAENGAVALELIFNTQGQVSNSNGSQRPDAQTYDVVFLDNQMPVLSGLETVSKLREVGRTELVVGVTGNALLLDQQEYLDAGVDYVITKPVFERNLKSALSMALERRERVVTISQPPPPPPPPPPPH